ncbi:MAG: hypothetical protein GY835_11745, partial [bacterium]|nr:hypothetical protein [bacterium]
MNARNRLFYCYLEHRWQTRCDVVRYIPNMQAPMFCYQMELALHFPVVIDSVRQEAAKMRRPADQMMAWIQMNLCGLLQRYAQEFEKKCGMGATVFCKGDLFQLIKNAGGFEQNTALWDSPFNLR